MEQNENTLSVLKIAPGQYPQQVEIDNELKALQQAVGGSIGASYPFEDPVAIVYNDDSASFEAKKMIVSQLIRRVEVYRGYQIHVDFNFDLAQYLENSDELAC